MISGKAKWVTVAVALALALLPAGAAAAPKFDAEFPVPGISTENKLVAGPDGNVWVTVSAGEKDVARITPAGVVTEFELKEGLKEVKDASGIAVDADGRLWVTGRTAIEEGLVVRFQPANPEGSAAITEIPQVKKEASIVLGPDKKLWIASEAVVIAIVPTDPDPDATKVLHEVAGMKPHDIDVAGQQLVIPDQEGRIVTLTIAGAVKEYSILGFSQGVAGLPSGQIAFSDSGADPQRVGQISPASILTTLQTPPPGGDPFGVTVGSDGAFWLVMSAFNELARLAPGGQQLTFVKGMQSGSLARQIAAGPDNTLWATVTKGEAEGVAKFSGLEPPTTTTDPPPETRIARRPGAAVRAKGRRAAVRFSFSSPGAGASFECRVVRIAKGAKVPAFAACASPKSYSVAPGRYRFEVRAVVNGVADASPAVASFRVVRVRRHRPRHHR